MDNTNHYRFSFTACSLRVEESLLLAEQYLRLRDWGEVRTLAIQGNLLNQRTTSSLVRLVRELLSRMKCLSDDELIYLCDTTEQEKRLIVWLAICRRYSFIRDFTNEVLKVKASRLDYETKIADFSEFYASKSLTHRELSLLTHSTQQKVRQIIFRMLTEADLIDSKSEMRYVTVSQSMLDTFDKRTIVSFIPLSNIVRTS